MGFKLQARRNHALVVRGVLRSSLLRAKLKVRHESNHYGYRRSPRALIVFYLDEMRTTHCGNVKSHMPTAASHTPRIEPLTDLHPSLTLQGVKMERGHGSPCSKQARAPSVLSRFGISVSGPPTTPESTTAANHDHAISKVRRR